MLNDFTDNEIQEFLREIGIQSRIAGQFFQPADLSGFPFGICRRQLVRGLEFADRLRVPKPFTERVDENRIKPIYTVPVILENPSKSGGVFIDCTPQHGSDRRGHTVRDHRLRGRFVHRYASQGRSSGTFSRLM